MEAIQRPLKLVPGQTAETALSFYFTKKEKRPISFPVYDKGAHGICF